MVIEEKTREYPDAYAHAYRVWCEYTTRNRALMTLNFCDSKPKNFTSLLACWLIKFFLLTNSFARSKMSRKLAILGGGISGVSLAYFLSRNFARGKLPWKIVLFERRSQAGGWLRSQRGPSSLLWEQGTRSMAPKQRHYRALMEMVRLICEKLRAF